MDKLSYQNNTLPALNSSQKQEIHFFQYLYMCICATKGIISNICFFKKHFNQSRSILPFYKWTSLCII